MNADDRSVVAHDTSSPFLSSETETVGKKIERIVFDPVGQENKGKEKYSYEEKVEQGGIRGTRAFKVTETMGNINDRSKLADHTHTASRDRLHKYRSAIVKHNR